MTTESASSRLRRAMARTSLNPEQQVEVLREFVDTHARRSLDWHMLRKPLARVITTLTNGRPRWLPNRAPVYQAYLDLALATRARIWEAQHRSDKPTLKAVYAESQVRGEAAGVRHWCEWVTPVQYEATLKAFEKLYARERAGSEPRTPVASPRTPVLGSRITPFMTATQRLQLRDKWQRLMERVQVHIDNGAVPPPGPDYAEPGLGVAEVYRLRYNAAQQALPLLAHHARNPSPARLPPTQWTHMLDPESRARLRAAERTAGGTGLTRP